MILSLYDDVVYWPSVDERGVIAERIFTKYGFPHCVGLVDGTLIPFVFKLTLNGED